MSNQSINAYPMGSRITDMVNESSMLVNTLGPRILKDHDALKLTGDIYMMEGTLRNLGALSNAMKFENYGTRNVENQSPKTLNRHAHFIFDAGGKFSVGNIEFHGIRLVEENKDGDVSYKSSLNQRGNVRINIVDGSGKSLTSFTSGATALEVSFAISRLGLSIFQGVGSLLKELSSVLYKGKLNKDVVSVPERAAIMRVQDDGLRNLLERTQANVISDGFGPSGASAQYYGQLVCDDWSRKILAYIAPIVHNWLFKGEALGEPGFKIVSTKG